jgi:hypothetical protein
LQREFAIIKDVLAMLCKVLFFWILVRGCACTLNQTTEFDQSEGSAFALA